MHTAVIFVSIAAVLASVTIDLVFGKCQLRDYYYDGCNNCTCNGESYSCTEKLCPDNPIQCFDVNGDDIPTCGTLTNCVRKTYYYDGCNRCNCVGSGYACTRMLCSNNPIKCCPK